MCVSMFNHILSIISLWSGGVVGGNRNNVENVEDANESRYLSIGLFPLSLHIQLILFSDVHTNLTYILMENSLFFYFGFF